MKPATAVLVALCAAPIVARQLSPTVLDTDGCYGHAAFMLATGHQPYLDFTQVAFPLAEGALALLIRVFGPELRVIELATATVIAAVALALYFAGRRLAGPRAGAVAALAWVWSPWVLRFNLFERETWAALGAALALGVHARLTADEPSRVDRRVDRRATTALAGALALAFLIKITAVAVAAGLLLQLLLAGRPRQALAVAWRYALILSVATVACWLIWGAPFLQQVYLFGFFRYGPDHSALRVLTALQRYWDPIMALGIASLLAFGLPGLRRAEGGAALVLLAYLAYMLFASPVMWDHQLVDLAAPAALLSGVALARWRERKGALAAAVIAVVIAVALTPARAPPPGPSQAVAMFQPWERAFGGTPRDILHRRAGFIARWSEPDDLVVTSNPWWSFEAGRVEFVRYWDLQPVLEGIQASLAADGLRATFAKRQGPLLLGPGMPEPDARTLGLQPYYGREVANSLAYVRPRLLAALERGEIALVLEPLPRFILEPADLERAGYERFGNFEKGVVGWRVTSEAASEDAGATRARDAR